MTTGTYTIDATNNTEPTDSRYVADFPAELRAMKTRMNSAISSIGTLTGALMADGTNYMTGKLGIGMTASASYMLDVFGNSRFSGNITVNDGRAIINNGASYVPGNVAVQNSGFTVSGAYGGGITMVDGAAYLGAYSIGGDLWFGLGTSAGLQGRLRVMPSGVTAYGNGTSEIRSEAASGYAAFLAKSSGTNSSYAFFWNATGERGRITVADDASFTVSRGPSATISFSLDGNGNAQVHGDQLLIGTASSSVQQRLGFINSVNSNYLYSNTDGSFGFWDSTNAKSRWVCWASGYFGAETGLQAGFGQAGDKYIEFNSNSCHAYFYMRDTSSELGLYDVTAAKTRWTSELNGTFSAPTLRATDATKTLGYSAGTGGAVTQPTNKSTGVTLNKPTGRIVTHNESIAPGGYKYFPVSNSLVTANSVVCVSADPTTCSAVYNITTYVSNGLFIVLLHNASGVTLADAIGLNFVVLNGASS